MAIEVAGFLYNSSGAAVNAATVNLYDRNTTTPVRATTTTNASGYWAISHGTEGRFDVEIVNGTTYVRLKYDDAFQVQELETSVLKLRNPADTFAYDLVPGAITAARTLNVPVITGTDTLAVLGLAQVYTAGPTWRSATAGTAAGTVENTTDNASVLTAIFQGDRATPADNDLAYISLRLSDSAGNQDEGARIEWQATTVLNGATQDGDLILYALVNNTLTAMLRLDGSDSEIDALVDVDYVGSAARWSSGVAVVGTEYSVQRDADATNQLHFNVPTGATYEWSTNDVQQMVFGAGILYINDTANINMTVGLTIHGGGSDLQHLTLRNSDVITALTTGGPFTTGTNDFFVVQKQSATLGGVVLYGIAEDPAGVRGAFDIYASGGQADTTSGTTATSLIGMHAGEHDGANAMINSPAGSLLFGIIGRVAGAERAVFFVDAEGDLHIDGNAGATAVNATVFDDWDDVALVRAFDSWRGPDQIIRSDWDAFVRYGHADLVRAGIVSAPPEGKGDPMVNITQLQRLHNGAIWQLGRRISERESEIAALKAEIAEIRRALPAA